MGEDQNCCMAEAKFHSSLSEFAEYLCADDLGPELGKVGTKFIRNMLHGISSSRSVN